MLLEEGVCYDQCILLAKLYYHLSCFFLYSKANSIRGHSTGTIAVSGNFWGSQKGFQGPFRPSGRNRGLPLRRRRGQGPHLAKRWEPRGFLYHICPPPVASPSGAAAKAEEGGLVSLIIPCAQNSQPKRQPPFGLQEFANISADFFPHSHFLLSPTGHESWGVRISLEPWGLMEFSPLGSCMQSSLKKINTILS